jgi:hypothetical protein
LVAVVGVLEVMAVVDLGGAGAGAGDGTSEVM